MNAVAVGFIVEIDDFLYAQFLTAHDRSSYESEQASSPRGSFAQIVPGGALVVSLCTASVFFLGAAPSSYLLLPPLTLLCLSVCLSARMPTHPICPASQIS